MIEARHLASISSTRHGFFTRRGGHSSGLFASLNCGYGSNDDAATIARNRAQVAKSLGLTPQSLLTVHQVHSAQVVTVDGPWDRAKAPRADGMVTRRAGLALGVLTADCAPILFADQNARVIGAAHAGWRGALAGVGDAVISAMTEIGAARASITAAIGPSISRQAYEVGHELFNEYMVHDPENGRFFTAAAREGHYMFDLTGYIAARLAQAGLKSVETIDACTYLSEDAYFSYRRATHREQPDYGRQISAIALTPAPTPDA